MRRPSRELIEKLYIHDKRPSTEIAQILGAHFSTVLSWVRHYGLPVRGSSNFKGLRHPEPDELRKLYVDEMKNTHEIARLFRTNPRTVGLWLRKNQIPVRTSRQSRLKNRVLPSRNGLQKAYLDEKLSIRIMAKRYGVSEQAILTSMNHAGIPRRSLSDARKTAYATGRAKPNAAGEQLWKHNPFKGKRLPEAVKQKMIATKRRLHAEGKIGIWNRGLTKMDDERILRSSERLSALRRGKAPWNKQAVPPKADLMKLYVDERRTMPEIAEFYNSNAGTVSDWLKSYGIPARRSRYGTVRGKSSYLTCEDGHRVRSSYERVVCNWLTRNNIPHEIEPHISRQRKFRADFKIIGQDIYIEVLGLKGKEDYDKRSLEKQNEAGAEYARKTEDRRSRGEPWSGRPMTIHHVAPKQGRITEIMLEKELGYLTTRTRPH